MTKPYGGTFDQVVSTLRKHCALTKPAKVIIRSLYKQQLCGCCVAYLDNEGKIKRFDIEIDRQLSQLTAIDTLLHEWAHALDQDRNGPAREPHRESWGKCYAKVWRAYAKYLDA
jgi:hypothetical protein